MCLGTFAGYLQSLCRSSNLGKETEEPGETTAPLWRTTGLYAITVTKTYECANIYKYVHKLSFPYKYTCVHTHMRLPI